MRCIGAMLFSTLTFFLTPTVFASYTGYTAPNETQCKEILEKKLLSLKEAQATGNENARTAFEQASKIVQDNRQRHISDCKSWRSITRSVPQ